MNSEEYIRRHRLKELFEMLYQSLLLHQPADARGFLRAELQRYQTEGSAADVVDLSQVDLLFNLYDKKARGFILSEECREGLNKIAVTKKQEDDIRELVIQDQVNLQTFRQLAQSILKLRSIAKARGAIF